MSGGGTLAPEARDWLEATGFTVGDEALWHAALTHGSLGEAKDYERLEFLGDRVLGLAVADWLYRRSEAPEGRSSQRLNALVSREMCAETARGLGLAEHIRISKQASADGGRDSDNILGDVMESLLGAQFIENGFASARDLVHELWRPALESGAGQRKHPKSAPQYEVTDRSGPDHAAQFTVKVSVFKVGEAEATAGSKSEAEREAAREFMEKYG